MANYVLRKMNPEGTLLHPTGTLYTDSYAEQNADLLLRSRLVEGRNGKFLNEYRLIAKNPHTIEMMLAYDIECPECGKNLRLVGRSLNSRKLGLYRCPSCDKNKGGA